MSVREDLILRREKLRETLAFEPGDDGLARLLGEVDAALGRVDAGTFGLCETCHEPIEEDRLAADPLLRFCIDHLSREQRDALSNDLALAAQIQSGLLPPAGLSSASWETAYRYIPANMVSGDYCDFLECGEGLFFAVGDVSGKGVSAGLLMAHLNATFRALVAQAMPLEKVLASASRIFCESSLGNRFATLACGRAMPGGEVEFCIAGHNPVLLLRGGEVEKVKATGLPLGMFCDEKFAAVKAVLGPGDAILLYTDGITEAEDRSGADYGMERLAGVLRSSAALPPAGIVEACLSDLQRFAGAGPRGDDITVMALKRMG